MTRQSQRGFTLLEVMIALAILASALVIAIGAVVSNLETAKRAQRLGVAVELARGKMYDVEEMLLEDGFQELDQDESGEFSDEGWNEYEWQYQIEKIELPGLATLQGAEDAADGGDDGGERASAGGGDQSASGLAGFGLVASQFEMISNVLERSIRRVTLTVKWKAGNRDETTTVVVYFTNPQGIREAMAGVPQGGEESTPPTGSDNPPTRRGAGSGGRGSRGASGSSGQGSSGRGGIR